MRPLSSSQRESLEQAATIFQGHLRDGGPAAEYLRQERGIDPASVPAGDEGEEWREPRGYEGVYAVSSLGRVARLSPPRVLKPEVTKQGYRRLRLCKGGAVQRFLVHRLVLLTFRGEPSEPPPDGIRWECCHLNGIPGDDRLVNLAWGSTSENQSHRALHGTDQFGERNVRAVLTTEQVLAIRADHRSGLGYKRLAKKYGVTQSCAQHIITRRTWRHV